MEFWDGTRYIRHIRRGPPGLPVKTILVLLVGAIAAAAWLWQVQRHVQPPADPCPATPTATAPAATGALSRSRPPRSGLTAGPAVPSARSNALRPGTTAVVTTSGPVASATGPVAAQPVVLAATPSPSSAPARKPKGKPSATPGPHW